MILFLLFLGCLTYLVYFYMKIKKLPPGKISRFVQQIPGPLPIPILGNLIQIGISCFRGNTIVETMKKWQKKYGNVYTMWIGPMPIVNICDYETAQEAMVKKGANFADRPNFFLAHLIRGSYLQGCYSKNNNF